MIEMIIRSILHARCVYNYSANDPNGIDRDNYFHYLLPLKHLLDRPRLFFSIRQNVILGVLFSRAAVRAVRYRGCGRFDAECLHVVASRQDQCNHHAEYYFQFSS